MALFTFNSVRIDSQVNVETYPPWKMMENGGQSDIRLLFFENSWVCSFTIQTGVSETNVTMSIVARIRRWKTNEIRLNIERVKIGFDIYLFARNFSVFARIEFAPQFGPIFKNHRSKLAQYSTGVV